MLNFKTFTLLAFAAFVFSSCKKESKPAEVEPVVSAPLKDSVSFTINNVSYVFDAKTSVGVGNRPVNVKKSAVEIAGGKLYTTTGGFYFYGEPDSTMYDLHYTLYNSPGITPGRFSISFNKRFRDAELQEGQFLRALKNNLSMFTPGTRPYATDIEMEGALDGISIGFLGQGIAGSTNMPGFSMIVRPSDNKRIQEDSHFEITNVKSLKGKNGYSEDIYLVEAKFEANLYNDNCNKYRIKNGYLSMRVNVNYNNDLGIFTGRKDNGESVIK